MHAQHSEPLINKYHDKGKNNNNKIDTTTDILVTYAFSNICCTSITVF
jgi:hypothetical protein